MRKDITQAVRLLSLSETLLGCRYVPGHYCDVIMGAMASQITSLTIVYSTVHSGPDERKHQSSALLAICAGNSPVTGEFPAQMASNAENVSIWWRHHVMRRLTVDELIRMVLYCDMTLSQDFKPMVAHFSLKAALPLAEGIATVPDRCHRPWLELIEAASCLDP